MRTLYLIDGYAQFYRAYHAIRTPMTSPVTGEPTNMTFGFVGMLLKLLRGEGHAGDGEPGGRPRMVAVALDVSGDRGTFRSRLYPPYKATRPPPPEDLRPQVQRCLAILRTIGVPIHGAEGFEADDVIATIASRLADDLRLRVISKDKDLKQLLAPSRVELYDIHTDALYTADTLAQETGLAPSQVPDMLALMGDAVDNVPGVEGVGPKTAAQLIAEHGSLDALLADVDRVPGKRGEKLRAAGPALTLSRQLVTLARDAPIELDLDAAEVARFDLAALRPILSELGFNRYRDELRQLLGEPEPHHPRSGPGAAREPDSGLFAPAAREGRPALDSGSFAEAAPAPLAARAPAFQEPSLFDALAPAPAHLAPESGTYTIVRTEADLAELVRALRAASAISIDTETTGVRPMHARLCGLSFAVEPGRAWYVPVRSPEASAHLGDEVVLEALRPVLEDPALPKIGHNLKFDLLVLRRAGVRLRGFSHPSSCDTMIASYVLNASRSSHRLDALALAMLGRHNIELTTLIGSGPRQRSFDAVPLELAGPYAAEDADVALQLALSMKPEIERTGLSGLMHDLEMPLVPVLAELEWNGVRVDRGILAEQRAELEQRVRALRAELDDEAMRAVGRTFDPDSPRQLAAVLFAKPTAAEPGLGLRPLRRNKTGPSTDHEVLEKLVQDPAITSPIPRLVLDYRQLTKLVSTYLVALADEIHPDTGRIHSSFSQTVAATGRLASSDPNLQNIPIRTDVGRAIRRAFVAEPGHVLITADYSQIELRLLAHLSRDPALILAFHEGQDIHRAVAAQIHGVRPDDVTRDMRNGAKMVNFGIVYGITAFGLARRLGVSNARAGEIIEAYKRRFAGITTFLEECIAQARDRGYVETMMKRRRPIREIDSSNPARRALAERMAINSVVQGSAADLIKLAMIDLHERTELAQGGAREAPRRAADPPPQPEPALRDARMILQIHDELVFEAPEQSAEAAAAVIVTRMERAMTLDVPLVADVSISRDWYDGK